jgi:hypothetical protein
MKPRRDGDTQSYKPTPKDWQYVSALRETMLEGGPMPRAALMRRMGFSHRSSLLRFEANVDRMAWVRAQLHAGREHQWELLLEKAFALGMKGQCDWAIFFAKGIGRYGQAETSTPVTIINHIPRPPAAPGVDEEPGTAPEEPKTAIDVLDLVRRKTH